MVVEEQEVVVEDDDQDDDGWHSPPPSAEVEVPDPGYIDPEYDWDLRKCRAQV